MISSGADGILPESALEGFAEYDSADPVDTFVNAIFLYDDKMVLTYNFHESTETITFGELQEVLPNGFRGSDMNLATEPRENSQVCTNLAVFLYISEQISMSFLFVKV